MSSFRNYFSLAIGAVLLSSINVWGQSAPAPGPELKIKTVQVTASAQQAEVGQTVKISVTATDASGNVVTEKPSAFFAGPFDIAAVDDDGNVKLFGTGEVTVGALVGGKPGFTTLIVKPPSIKTVEIASLSKPLVVGGVNSTQRGHAHFQRRPAHRCSD